MECMELHLGVDEEPTKSLWVRIKGRAGTGDIIVGVCSRPPDQDEALYRSSLTFIRPGPHRGLQPP